MRFICKNTLGRIYRRGYTVVELMVVVVIVSVIVATMGASLVKLLTFQENDREEAYIKEKLAETCANFADYISLGTNINFGSSSFVVSYRHETGGVSWETGRVSRVANMTTSLNFSSDDDIPTTMALRVAAFEQGTVNTNKFSRNIRGDDTLLMPLVAINELRLKNKGRVDLGYRLNKINSAGSLWNLCIEANYEVEDDEQPHRTVTAERIVRLWNRR